MLNTNNSLANLISATTRSLNCIQVSDKDLSNKRVRLSTFKAQDGDIIGLIGSLNNGVASCNTYSIKFQDKEQLLQMYVIGKKTTKDITWDMSNVYIMPTSILTKWYFDSEEKNANRVYLEGLHQICSELTHNELQVNEAIVANTTPIDAGEGKCLLPYRVKDYANSMELWIHANSKNFKSTSAKTLIKL